MHTQLIPSEQWNDFLIEFSRAHVGWPVTIETLAGESGAQKQAVDVALLGIGFDTKGTRPSSLMISVGDENSPHVQRVIDLPLHIRTAEDHEGNIHMQIEPADGPPTLIHLRPPLH